MSFFFVFNTHNILIDVEKLKIQSIIYRETIKSIIFHYTSCSDNK